jgi:hypothetical protein
VCRWWLLPPQHTHRLQDRHGQLPADFFRRENQQPGQQESVKQQQGKQQQEQDMQQQQQQQESLPQQQGKQQQQEGTQLHEQHLVEVVQVGLRRFVCMSSLACSGRASLLSVL